MRDRSTASPRRTLAHGIGVHLPGIWVARSLVKHEHLYLSQGVTPPERIPTLRYRFTASIRRASAHAINAHMPPTWAYRS